MMRVGYCRSPEDVLRMMRATGAGWHVVKPCRFRRGCVVWVRYK